MTSEPFLEILRRGYQLRSTNIATELGCLAKTVKRELDALRIEGFIEFIGASHSTHVDKTVARIEKFLRDAVSLVCDNITARFYGDIKTLLRRKGRPIPDNDIRSARLSLQMTLQIYDVPVFVPANAFLGEGERCSNLIAAKNMRGKLCRAAHRCSI